MKICKPHWDKLRKAITDKGMGHLVASDDQSAIEKMAKELRGEPTNFEPLMSAHNMIVTNALAAGGLYLMGQDKNGKDYCPLCEVKEHYGANTDEDWIKSSTDACLEHCKKQNLINQN